LTVACITLSELQTYFTLWLSYFTTILHHVFFRNQHTIGQQNIFYYALGIFVGWSIAFQMNSSSYFLKAWCIASLLILQMCFYSQGIGYCPFLHVILFKKQFFLQFLKHYLLSLGMIFTKRSTCPLKSTPQLSQSNLMIFISYIDFVNFHSSCKTMCHSTQDLTATSFTQKISFWLFGL